MACAISRVRRATFLLVEAPASRTINRSPPVFPRSASPIAQPQFTRPAKGSPRMPGMTAADVIHHHGKVYTHEGFCTSDPTAAPLSPILRCRVVQVIECI